MREYQIVYNSDLIISNPIDLSTFSIFYDKILLPYTTDDGRVLRMVKRKGKFGMPSDADWFEVSEILEKSSPVLEYRADKWDDKHRILFDEGVFQRLDKADSQAPGQASLKRLSLLFLRSRATEVAINDDNDVFIPASLVDNLLRGDIDCPSIFTIRQGSSRREIYKAAEALHTFKYLMPRLSRLHPEEILEVRSKLKDLREGFSLHLQRLSAKVESALQENSPWDEISRIARNVIETELIPDYREFRRSLMTRRIGFWARVFNMAGQVIQINALPWKPAFWSRLAMTAGSLVATETKERREGFSNADLAYRFMHVCEG